MVMVMVKYKLRGSVYNILFCGMKNFVLVFLFGRKLKPVTVYQGFRDKNNGQRIIDLYSQEF